MTDEATEPIVSENHAAEESATLDEQLGDSGKKALDAERASRKAAEDREKTLTAKLKELEDRDKSEADKAAERLAEAEKRATEVEARATRAEVSVATSIPVDILAGPRSSNAEDVTAFATLVAEYAADFSKKNSAGPVIPTQGKQPPAALNSSKLEDALRAAVGAS